MIKMITTHSDDYKDIVVLTHPYMKGDLDLEIKNMDVEKGAVFGTPEFNLLSTKQTNNFTNLMKSMNEGDIVFACDSDVLINERPSWFVEQLGDNDCIFQQDRQDACLGFFVVRVSPKTIKAFERVDEMTTATVNNQMAFNMIKDSTGLKIAYFDTRDVWTFGNLNDGVWNGQPFEFPDGVKAFHANYTIGFENKRKLLEMAIKKYK